jgi:mannose-6-phosphate isomerase-like protein (cupin superfamily)
MRTSPPPASANGEIISAVQLRRLSDAPVRERGLLQSHLLLDAGELGARNLVVTWVEVAPGGEQRPHSHTESEQAYVIVRGQGQMTVAGEQRDVVEGDLVLIPPTAEHAIANTGDETLVYVSAASPPESMAALYHGQLVSEGAPE